MDTILQVLLMFFGSTAVCHYVLAQFGINARLNLSLSIIFGILSAIFLTGTIRI